MREIAFLPKLQNYLKAVYCEINCQTLKQTNKKNLVSTQVIRQVAKAKFFILPFEPRSTAKTLLKRGRKINQRLHYLNLLKQCGSWTA